MQAQVEFKENNCIDINMNLEKKNRSITITEQLEICNYLNQINDKLFINGEKIYIGDVAGANDLFC